MMLVGVIILMMFAASIEALRLNVGRRSCDCRKLTFKYARREQLKNRYMIGLYGRVEDGSMEGQKAIGAVDDSI
jgi:hypothetical protein